MKRSRGDCDPVTRRIHKRRRRRDSHKPGLVLGPICEEDQQRASQFLSSYTLSLSLVAFRLTFHTTTACGQLVLIRGRDRRSVALKHDFLLLQPGRGGSEWGANGKGEMGEVGRTSGEVQGGETRR